jgi:hypothetical protein
MRLFGLVLISAFMCNSSVLAQSSFQDEFDAHNLNWEFWCACQINIKRAPILFPPDRDQMKDRVAAITVDDASLGGNVCRYGSPYFECKPTDSRFRHTDDDLVEPLGPNQIHAPAVAFFSASTKNPYCTDDVMRRAIAANEEGLCIQRQELRLQKRYRHSTDTPHLYSLRFRLPKKIEDRKNSIRWITAQWKQEPVSGHYQREFGNDWGPSPFLAQRFDNGVLHVTVQDEHCRCKVASAPYPNGSNPVWADGRAQYCESTKPRHEGETCTPELYVKYGANPILSTGLGHWVELSYRVEANRLGPAVIEVHEGERFIVRVTGKIGYESDERKHSVTKFKLGHYRDYMPFVHAMEIDWLRVAPINK